MVKWKKIIRKLKNFGKEKTNNDKLIKECTQYFCLSSKEILKKHEDVGMPSEH